MRWLPWFSSTKSWAFFLIHGAVIWRDKVFFIVHSLLFDDKGWSSLSNQEGTNTFLTWFKRANLIWVLPSGQAHPHPINLAKHPLAASWPPGSCQERSRSLSVPQRKCLNSQGEGERSKQSPRGQLTSSHPWVRTLKSSTNRSTFHSEAPSHLHLATFTWPPASLWGDRSCVSCRGNSYHPHGLRRTK